MQGKTVFWTRRCQSRSMACHKTNSNNSSTTRICQFPASKVLSILLGLLRDLLVGGDRIISTKLKRGAHARAIKSYQFKSAVLYKQTSQYTNANCVSFGQIWKNDRIALPVQNRQANFLAISAVRARIIQHNSTRAE